MPAAVNDASVPLTQLPSGAPKLIDTTPPPILLASATPPSRVLLLASLASISTMRASGAIACAHCTSSAISAIQSAL